MANPRKIAVKTLLKIDREGAFSNLALTESLQASELSPKDKALTSALVYGVLDRKITLDYILSRFMKSPVEKTSPFTLQVLRTALYQILYMDKIPQSAAVNEAVKLVKQSGESRNSGFVNATLRAALRTPVALPEGDSAQALSIRYSCPTDIVAGFIADYGLADAKALLEESLKPAETTIRINTVLTDLETVKKALSQQGVRFRDAKSENSLDLLNGVNLAQNPLYQKGFFFAQDSASQKAVSLLGPQPGQRVLDLCAAPGGKSFTMAGLMQNRGEIIACELYEHRAALIARSAERLGLSIIKTCTQDATVYNPQFGLFDCVLCDVPCSGLGVIRRKPDIKYRSLGDVKTLEETQYRILCNAVKYLKKGGKILYSTCTLRSQENEKLVISFQKEYNCFVKMAEHTFMPHKDSTDGFYCALLKMN